MLYLGMSVIVQILCAIHVIRTGRNSIWIMVIVFFSILGCLAYILFEIMPSYSGNRHVRRAQASIGARLDPEKELRQARSQAEIADTVANRIRVADALAALGRHSEAEPLYRDALDRVHGDDWRTLGKFAATLFENGRSRDALVALERIPAAKGVSADQDQRDLMKARCLADLGEDAQARALFEDVMTRIPGETARCHYAAFLIERGDKGRARQVLEEVEARMKHLDRSQRALEKDMYSWAGEQLATLRAGG